MSIKLLGLFMASRESESLLLIIGDRLERSLLKKTQKAPLDGDLEIDQEALRFDNNWGWARIAIWFLLICHFFLSLTWSVLGRDSHLHVYCISL